MNRRKFFKYFGVVFSSIAALPVVAKAKNIVKYNPKDCKVFVEGKEVVGFADEVEFTIGDTRPCPTKFLLKEKLLAMPGVTEVKIIEDSFFHTVECVVRGGKDIDIATCIAFSLPANICTAGLHYCDVNTGLGYSSTIQFSRFD